MPNLDTWLAGLAEPRLNWIQGTVTEVNDGFLTLAYGDGEIENAAYLRQYTPTVGDQVHALSYEPMGVLVLGMTKVSVVPPPVETPLAPQIFTVNGTATYDMSLSTWTPGTLLQGIDKVACFFYTPSAFTALSGVFFQLAEIEITRVSGGPPEFIPHLNLNTSSPLSTPDDMMFWRPDVDLPIGVPTWVPLPVGWAQDLVSGDIKGIGIWTDLGSSGVYSGTGRVRLTQLSVTI